MSIKPTNDRRRFLTAAGACGLLTACESWNWKAPEKGPVAAFLPDSADNDTQAVYQGLMRMRERLGIAVEVQQAAGRTGLDEALRRMAASGATMVMVYGADATEALKGISRDYPAQRFSILQAEAAAPHMASYRVLHEQSAWLAGAAAGMLSPKKIVGHIGSEKTDAQLQSRAAFFGGLQTTAPQAKFLSSIKSGDAASLTRAAAAQIAAGAEIIFHTLPTEDAALAALARERRVPLIGRGPDWIARTPGVYIASAFADPGAASYQAGQDLYDGLWKAGLQRRIGLENSKAVRIILADKTPAPVQERIGLLQREIASGGYKIPASYDGAEFNT